MNLSSLALLLMFGGAAAVLAGASTLGCLLTSGFVASFLVLVVRAYLEWWSLSPEERKAERERLQQDPDTLAW